MCLFVACFLQTMNLRTTNGGSPSSTLMSYAHPCCKPLNLTSRRSHNIFHRSIQLAVEKVIFFTQLKMAASLKRIVDYKLLYDILADPSNGMIQLATLTTRWPKDLAANIKLPRGLPEYWCAASDDNGYLDWERFSSALKKALEEDKPRLSKTDGSQTPPSFGEEKMSVFQQRKGAQAPRVRAEEIEMFLSTCKGDILAQALSRTRKEVYKCQMSLHQLESTSMAAASSSISGKNAQSKQPDSSSINSHVKVIKFLCMYVQCIMHLRLSLARQPFLRLGITRWALPIVCRFSHRRLLMPQS